MFETFRNAWKTEDLRKRLLYTLLILILFRLGCAIPVPYITSSALESMFTTGSMLTYLNMMSGGAMSRCTIFALGVQPYINATIIIQLLCVAIPYLENLSKEGEEGRQKLTKISNYTGAAIALLFSILKVTPAPFWLCRYLLRYRYRGLLHRRCSVCHMDGQSDRRKGYWQRPVPDDLCRYRG